MSNLFNKRIVLRLTPDDFLTNGVPVATMMQGNQAFCRLAKSSRHLQTHILSNLRRKNSFQFPLPRVRPKREEVDVLNDQSKIETVKAVSIYSPFNSDVMNNVMDTLILHNQPRSELKRIKEPTSYGLVYSDGLNDESLSKGPEIMEYNLKNNSSTSPNYDPYNDASGGHNYYEHPPIVLLTPQFLMPAPEIPLEKLALWNTPDNDNLC